MTLGFEINIWVLIVSVPYTTRVRSLYYLTLTLTLQIIIGFKDEFGFGTKYLGFNSVRSLYNLTLTQGASPPDPPFVPYTT